MNIVFNDYLIETAEFHINHEFLNGNNDTPDEFPTNIIKSFTNEDTNFNARLYVEVGEKNSDKFPFFTKVAILGSFTVNTQVNDKEEELIKINTVSTLYPYLRAAVSHLMSICNVPQVIIPIIDIQKWFGEENDDNE